MYSILNISTYNISYYIAEPLALSVFMFGTPYIMRPPTRSARS